jgi:hypothetical protein
MTTNNACDYILLVDDEDTVVSAWQADEGIVQYYLSSTDAQKWWSGKWPEGLDPRDAPNEDADLDMISAYGEEVGRDGRIEDARRAEAWDWRIAAWEKKQRGRRRALGWW